MRAKNIIGILKIFLELSAGKRGDSSDSGYDYSQPSESESSHNSIVLEMEDDSTSLSQASLDERLEASEKNVPIPFLSDLEGKLYLTKYVRTISARIIIIIIHVQ